ncbi:MAG: protein kinase domain-containing protein [bacterium]
MESPLIGKVIDNYRILEMLGKGGMGLVYKAMDINTEKIVALKMMDPLLAHDEVFLKRFRQEAKALAKSENRHIVNIFALRETEAGLLLVMEYVQGPTLEQWITQNGAMPYRQALPIMKQLITAIGYAHRSGVIHRDLKSNNVMITSEGEVKVADFGLAKIARSGSTTRTLSTGGTLHYMSPEQVQELPNIDHRSDIYSLGMTCYEMLAGRTPFQKNQSDLAIGNAIVREKFPPPHHFQHDVPPSLSRIVMKAIEKEQARRFQSAEEMLSTIDEFEQKLLLPQPQSSAPPATIKKNILLAAVAALVIVSAGVFWLLLKPQISPVLPAKIFVSTVPEGAVVSLDGKTIGLTPVNDFSIPPGTYSLHFQKQDYVGFDTTIVCAENSAVPIFVVLHQLGRVSFRISPGEATVKVDGTIVDSRQLMDLRLEPGEHVIQATYEGFEPLEQHLQVREGPNSMQIYTLRKQQVPIPPPIRPPADSVVKAVPTGPPRLRREPTLRLTRKGDLLSEATVKAMLKKRGFFDANWNKIGNGIRHQYESAQTFGQVVIIDQTTGLMWQQGGSAERMTLRAALTYIETLNRNGFAGCRNWRLPTLEEAMSLMEPQTGAYDLHIASRFDPKQYWIWTTDAESGRKVWAVDFGIGCCSPVEATRASYIRAVRTGSVQE